MLGGSPLLCQRLKKKAPHSTSERLFEEEHVGVSFGISVQFLQSDDLMGLHQMADHGEAGITTLFARQTHEIQVVYR